MFEDNTIPIWKKLYQIVSGDNGRVTSEVIDNVFKICKEKLIHVLLQFKPYTKESFKEWKKLSEKMLISRDDELCTFIHRLSEELDLEANMSWCVICNFLVFDYCGKVDELKSIIRYEANVKSLIDHIWYFYSADRMFLLKSLRFIFEKHSEKSYMFSEKINDFIKSLSIKKLFKNLLKTFEYLISEIDREKRNRISTDTLTKWVQRNSREQVEVLLLIIHVLNAMPLDGDELLKLLKLFMKHGFGTHFLFFCAEPLSRTKDIMDIRNAEIGVILTVIHRYWQNPELCKMLPKDLERDLEQYQIHGDNSTILFIWVIFKATISNDHLEYCNNALEALIEKKVFKDFSNFITLNIFQKSIINEIIMEGTNRLFLELMKICADYKYIYEQEGVVQIICELFKRPSLQTLENFGSFFKIGLDMFPFILDNFLDMVEALILSDEYYHKVLNLLHNCSTYCTELVWPYPSDAMHAVDEMNLFLGTDRFIIPAGTLTEKCTCYGEDRVKFHYKYDYFQVIEQYMRSLTMWVMNKGEYNTFILDYVLRANQFLSFLLKHYRGDFKDDKLITPLLRRLDCVPTYYNKGGFRNFDFFYVYFEVKCTLFMYQKVEFEDAFPVIVRKSMFPHITNYLYANEELEAVHANYDSILYSFLKEEENLKDHKLLLKYSELIFDILKKKILYKEVLYGGVWYLLNVVFVTHKQWNYEEAESFQQMKILNVCLQVFITVLQQIPQEHDSEDVHELYKLIHNSFLKNDCILNNLCSIFVKDKFYLQNLLNQETNWIAGQSLIVLETLKFELILLLLIYKGRARISKQKCVIDNRTHILAKHASLYFINSYNCTVAVLAGKFLQILAKDENIPLMSCLGLDYDQIQTLFLDRLRDPMEDDDIKINILNLISSCIFHQTGMTAAFFNIQSSKKWYDSDSKKKLERDTVADFMIDYLDNIKKSVAYLKSPLQVGILRVMAHLWQCEKQHLIKEVTSLEHFWPLLCNPLYKSFDQSPLVYLYIFKIISIQFTMVLRKDEKEDIFFGSVEKFFRDQKQLRLFQQYLSKILSRKDMMRQHWEERKLLIEAWTELLVTIHKQDKIVSFPNSECQYFYVELCLEGLQRTAIHKNILSTWLDFILIVINMFGLQFDQRIEDLSRSAFDLTKIVKTYYEDMTLKNKRVSLTLILEFMRGLKTYYEKHPENLVTLLDDIGGLFDIEHSIVEEKLWDMLKKEDPLAPNTLGPWAIFISIANYVLTFPNCQKFAVWFANRKYLSKIVKSTCDLLTYKNSLSAGKMALYSLTLYVQSPLAFDFLKVNMLQFYDRIEPMVNMLLTGQFSKINVLDLKEAWLIFTLLIRFNTSFLRRFQKNALESCYAFLTLNEHILKHIMNLPENTVDFKALDLLTQTLIFYNEMLQYWKIEWYRKSNKTFTFMIDGLRKVINSCIYLCLRPKHIALYYLDDYHRLLPVHRPRSVNNLMVAVINRLIGILNFAFSCLYKLNSGLLELFDFFEPEESITVLIQNDFSVPRFELPIPCDLTYGKLLCLAHFLCKTMNQLHQKNVKENVQIDEDKYTRYIGLVEHQDPSEHIQDQKLSSFLRCLYEYSGSIDFWINNLNYENIHTTADVLMLFIAQQTFLTITILEPHQMPYYKRNLYSELQFFNEYVKKRTSELLEGLNFHGTNQLSSYKIDMDLAKRYLLYKWENKKQEAVAERNFLLIISYWFSNICQIH